MNEDWKYYLTHPIDFLKSVWLLIKALLGGKPQRPGD